MALSSLLIANRGEIACRIIRTARARGMRTIAVYSDADRDAPHVRLADEAVRLGPGPATDSYLRGDAVIEAARRTRAAAIHPGYGFLSENADFARDVAAAGLVFIGPPAEAIRAMGNKAEAKRLMMAAGVPCIPGYEGADQSDTGLAEQAKQIGLPVMIKAAAGGGGRGMRLVHRTEELPSAIARARSEAENAFGSGELILEKAIASARHVEFQIMADAHGQVIHLGERDCSVQRRHQKVIEEAPCPVMTPDLRARMGTAAMDAARAVAYCGAGTVEFLLGDDGAFYFLEMNTRLQVEHPVTELVTGLDLVDLQLTVASGAHLPISQEDVALTGHAIEVRLYAEDPQNDYLPATGKIDLWRPAQGDGLRVDDGIASGQEISPFYDAMLAKIIAHGSTRDMARTRLIHGVESSVLFGLQTNTAFLADLLAHPVLAEGKATTGLLDDAYPAGFKEPKVSAAHLALAAACLAQDARDRSFARAGYVAAEQLGWASAPMPPARWTLICQGMEQDVHIEAMPQGWAIQVAAASVLVEGLCCHDNSCSAVVDGIRMTCPVHLARNMVSLAVGAQRFDVLRHRAGTQSNAAAGSGQIMAPMPGLVQDVCVQPGQAVAQGDTLIVLEAMKMQHQLTAPFDGTVTAVHAAAQSQVPSGSVLVELSARD
ncbi:ATP-grasp domain-containing protein [Aliishimia ponticola]|uniref:ATP-grasp domain-containing protein n=2 Tax=Aliishimia ponticola TaxID=2499833 RepID=A0A4S4NK56_9RHOB|nr:biotin carboxylase N-terminal domain-containing protein [Aliishimia ponticola]THH39157.1 ATP-grasp domain-containing protein [Aliishimia ponticola]